MADETSESSNKYTTFQMDQNSASSSRGNRKLFDSDTFETFTQSLFATAKTCHQAKYDDNTTERKLLETYHAGLVRIKEDIEKKLNKKW